MRLVLDTNVWLDWLVFDDAHIGPIRAATEAGAAEIFLDAPCAGELERALAYPLRGTVQPAEVCAAQMLDVRRRVCWFDGAPADAVRAALPVCRDRDDQKFLELARDCGAHWLLTRDKALLACARRRPPLPFRIGTPQQFHANGGAGA